MRRRRSGDGLVFLSPLALSNDPSGCHGRRWARSCRRHARCCRRQLSLNYELNLRLQSRLGNDVVNLPEALALKGSPIPRDHLVTWNSRRGSSSIVRFVLMDGRGNGNGLLAIVASTVDKPCAFKASKLKARIITTECSWNDQGTGLSLKHTMIQKKYCYICRGEIYN